MFQQLMKQHHWFCQFSHTCFLQVGVALFKDHPNAMFPFSAMDAGQRQYAEDVVATCMSQFQRQRNHSDDDDVACSSTEQITANVVMQMGGGCILYAEERDSSCCSSSGGSCCTSRANKQQKGQQQQKGQGCSSCHLLVNPKDVFETLCDCIFSSKRYSIMCFFIELLGPASSHLVVFPGTAARGCCILSCSFQAASWYLAFLSSSILVPCIQ